MSNEPNSRAHLDQPAVYQIRIKGHLGPHWIDKFEGMTLTHEDNGETLLTGIVLDQAALHGLLKKFRDFGMPLTSVNRIEPDPQGPSDLTK